MAARVLRRWLEAPSSARGFRALWGICGIFVPSISGKLRTTQSLYGRFKAYVRCRLPRCYCPGAIDRGDTDGHFPIFAEYQMVRIKNEWGDAIPLLPLPSKSGKPPSSMQMSAGFAAYTGVSPI